ncbi:MAG: hypothetical protein IPM56_14430 [Ignavibacteriales bacterium]|nr:MAG: hypothetical protein IPM56_14430 [Ignavibacteriales bacterium]
MINDNSILDELTGEKFASDALTTRFKNLAGKFCTQDVQSGIEFIHKFKETTRFYRFPLPPQLSEYFIRYEEAPLFFLYETPLTAGYEDFFRNRSDKKYPSEAHRSLMEFYSKWVTLKSISDKKFFANSMINVITKNITPDYFLSRIIHSIVLIYDQFFHDPFSARDVLKETDETIQKTSLDSNVLNEFRYFIKLLNGFSYLSQRDPINAYLSFSEALQQKPNGISAIFYQALASVHKNDHETAAELLKKVFQFDVDRLNYSAQLNNLQMFQYFVKFPVSANIFRQEDFAAMYRSIEEIIENNRKRDEVSLDALRNRLLFLAQQKLNEFYNEDIISTVIFLESVVQKYQGNNTTLFNAVTPKLNERIALAALALKKNISDKFMSEVNEKLSEFENKKNEHIQNIEKLKKEFEEIKLQSKQKLDRTISTIESNAAAFIAQSEEELTALNNNSKLNPINSFKTSMVYTIIATALVFLVGGIAGYTNTEYSSGSGFNDLMSGVIFQGIKWSVITFLLGTLISMAMAGFAFIDKSNYKHRLVQRINAIKSDKERQLTSAREKSKYRDKLLQDSLKDSIDHENKSIAKLKKDIEELSQKLTADAQLKISEEVKRIEPLLPD